MQRALGGKTCVTVSSFFMTKLTQGRKGAGSGFAYGNVKRWSKSYGSRYLSRADLILIPYHVPPSHWVLIVVELKQKRIVSYDSMKVSRWPWPGPCSCLCSRLLLYWWGLQGAGCGVHSADMGGDLQRGKCANREALPTVTGGHGASCDAENKACGEEA